MDEKLKEWDYAYVESLPDSAFLYVSKDGDKKVRKLPYKDKEGNVDLPHLRNAIVRLSQEKTDIPETVKKKLLAKARKLLDSINKKESQSVEEEKMPNEEKEQLYRDVNPKMHAEAAAKKEEKKEEVKEEEKVEKVEKKSKKAKESEELSAENVENAEIKESLSEDEKPAEESVEEKADEEEKVEDEKEQPADEEPKEEELSEEKEEEPAEEKEEEKEDEPAEEKPSEDESLSLDEEAKETKEELSVIKEVRDELVALYARNNELQKTVESLSAELESLKSEKENLNEQLSKYIEAEASINAKKRQERLESLSAKFKKLGQEKTVEQLSGKDDETLNEFEKIVDAALSVAAETSEQLSETEPSQGVDEETVSEEAPAEEPAEPQKEEAVEAPKSVSSEQFFAGILNKLADTQKNEGGRKVQFL